MCVLVPCAALLVAVASPIAAQSAIGVGTSAGVVKLTDQRSEEALSGVLEYQPNPWLTLYAIPAVLHLSDNVNGRPVSSSGLGDLPLVVAASYASPRRGRRPWEPRSWPCCRPATRRAASGVVKPPRDWIWASRSRPGRLTWRSTRVAASRVSRPSPPSTPPRQRRSTSKPATMSPRAGRGLRRSAWTWAPTRRRRSAG